MKKEDRAVVPDRERFCPPGGRTSWSGDIVGCHSGRGELLTSGGGWRPGTPLNPPQCTGRPHQSPSVRRAEGPWPGPRAPLHQPSSIILLSVTYQLSIQLSSHLCIYLSPTCINIDTLISVYQYLSPSVDIDQYCLPIVIRLSHCQSYPSVIYQCLSSVIIHQSLSLLGIY